MKLTIQNQLFFLVDWSIRIQNIWKIWSGISILTIYYLIDALKFITIENESNISVIYLLN